MVDGVGEPEHCILQKMFVPKRVQFNTTLWRKFFYANIMYNPTGFGTNTVFSLGCQPRVTTVSSTLVYY
jgi:hypothetical protein